MNTILNAIFVYRINGTDTSLNLSIPNLSKHKPEGGFPKAQRTEMQKEAYTVIEKWRDSNFKVVPQGYKIVWRRRMELLLKNNWVSFWKQMPV